MKWNKIGHIFTPDGSIPLMKTHASLPVAENVDGPLFRIYFSSRDDLNRSHTFSLMFDIESLKILSVDIEPVLSPGEPGFFDDSGAMASCILENEGTKYLYYIGWNLGVSVPFRNAIGLALRRPGENIFTKYSEGPIVDRSPVDPCFTASSCVLYEDGLFRMWYLSCVSWLPRHRYNIKYAESADGINWRRKGITAIDFKDDDEYAISVPRVLVEQGAYRMWFSHRGTPDAPAYRIGYAESADGITWKRNDQKAGLSTSESGWDSDMVCYPFVFTHNGTKYMLYNGNGYGVTGFGLAAEE